MSKNIYIVGAGVSGLIAAIELENAGYAPIILEATSHIGGRVHTQIIDEIPMDIGFQVLLEAYPAVKKYLDLNTIPHHIFLPGALLFDNNKQIKFGDPLRHLSFLLPTIMANIGSIADKYKIFKLSNQLKKQSVQHIFAQKNSNTIQFLQEYGFSASIIENFFIPFYTGIFLEPHLHTNAKMFCFVFKMFAEGNAILPKNGIADVMQQLRNRLKNTTILFHHAVTKIDDRNIVVGNKQFVADAIIVATEANSFLQMPMQQTINWHSCTNIYFRCTANTIPQIIIGLLTNKDTFSNNISFVPDTNIISVTVVKAHSFTKQQLIQQVQQELLMHCAITTQECIGFYEIKKALPKCTNMVYEPSTEHISVNEFTFLAGDYLANPSLNAAMLSGAKAAECVCNYLQN
jgi:protoporphyrinogen oxidase